MVILAVPEGRFLTFVKNRRLIQCLMGVMQLIYPVSEKEELI